MSLRLTSNRSSRKARRKVNVHQNTFKRGYISTIDNSRRPTDSLSDMTNMEVVQDNVVRPRPPLVRYGTQPTNTVIGRGDVRYGGERKIYWMMDDSGTGKVYEQTDGGAYTLVGGSYDDSAWAGFAQAKDKVYIFNGVDNLSFVDLTDDSVNTYSSLTTPTISSVTYSGTAGAHTHYYRVTANNEVGESIASAVVSDDSGKLRENWVENTDYCTISWGAITGATSYTIFYGPTSTTQYELWTVGSDSTTFVDYGTLATNPFRTAPDGDSSIGPVFTWAYVDRRVGQLFGITSDNKLYYSSVSAEGAASFASPDGGYVTIDEGGDTQLNFVDGFRNGKGDPVITVSARGAAGKGRLYHVTFDTLTVGDQGLTYANVTEANGQAGTYAPRATIKAQDALWYPTGQDFKSTGTSQNIVNILTTNTISQVIEPDVDRISLANLDKAVGVEYKDKLYFALPVGSSENNEIWYVDTARKNMWVLRWTVSAKDMWLYEDNDGNTHFCVLVDNKVLEFTRAGSRHHQDDDTAFRSRVAFESLVWDEDGINLGKIRRQYFKLLQPKGTITANANGLSRNGVETSAGSDTFTTTTTATGIGQWQYGGAFQVKDAAYKYGDDPGEIASYGKSVAVLEIKPKGLLAELSWEVVGEDVGTDYILSAVNTKGVSLEDLVLKTN